MKLGTIAAILGIVLCFGVFAEEGHFPLQKATGELYDAASLQRGAGVFMHYCAGCHSLQFARYNKLAKEIGIVDDAGQLLEEVAREHLNLRTDKLTDNILTAMPAEEATKWFGIAPPDLSLVARSRGKDWLYTYLKSFYVDAKRPWGVNNAVFKDVAMPHPLLSLQGEQEAVVDATGKLVSLQLTKPGSLKTEEYDQVVADLVNFLDHVGEPVQLKRKRVGVWVLLFLVIFVTFAYLLKREYWKDVH